MPTSSSLLYLYIPYQSYFAGTKESSIKTVAHQYSIPRQNWCKTLGSLSFSFPLQFTISYYHGYVPHDAMKNKSARRTESEYYIKRRSTQKCKIKMGVSRRLSVCVLFTIFYLPRTFSTPFVRRSLNPVGNGADGVNNDAGPIDSCVLLQESTVCGVNYSVPASLAKIAAAIELNIAGVTDSRSVFNTDECIAAAREVACAQRFPRCEVQEGGDVMVHLSSEDCEDRLRASCHQATVNVLLDNEYCSLRSSVRETAGCRSTAEFAADALAGSRELQYCTEDRQMTPWMYELLLYYDALFGGIADDLRRQFAETCYQRQANFTCQLLGQCSEDGQRVDVINTRQMCEDFINW